MKTEVAAAIRAIFNASNRVDADALLAKTGQKYATTAARLARWMESNIPQGLTVCAVPETHRRLLRTTNGLERVNQEIRRRTRVVGIFPNETACLGLVSAITMESSDEWEAGRAYLSFSAT
jgi:transposase-like protein